MDDGVPLTEWFAQSRTGSLPTEDAPLFLALFDELDMSGILDVPALIDRPATDYQGL